MSRLLSTVASIALVVGCLAVAPSASASPVVHPPSTGLHPTGALHDPGLRISPRRPLGVNSGTVPAAVDLSAWTVPVGDQGYVGSCVSWAISYGMNGWYSRYQGIDSTGLSFAPMYSYSQVHTSNTYDGGGTWPYAVYGIGTDQGTDTQADYWQGNYDFTDLPTAAEKANASHYKAGPFSYLYSSRPGVGAVDVIESAVAAHHPVAISFPVYSAFDNLNPSHLHLDASEVDSNTYRGGHEVLIVGYDATGVKIQNSWGTGWGLNGFAYLNWNFIESYTYDATMIPGLVASPSAPTTVTATKSDTAHTATLAWSPPTSTGGTAITGYRVARDGTDNHGSGPWSTTVSATTGSFRFGSLAPGGTYHLTVQAINAAGTGPTAGATVTMATAAPSVPTAVTATKADATHNATITWSPPTSTGGTAITGYRVARDGTDNHGSGPWSTTVSATTGSFRFGSLAPGGTYHLTVQAINAAGTGPAATATVTMATAAPSVPTAVTATKADATHNATITWSPPTSTGGTAITGYRVARDGTDNHGSGPWSTTVSATTGSFRFGSLAPGGTYHLTVQAINAAGTGPTAGATVTMATAA